MLVALYRTPIDSNQLFIEASTVWGILLISSHVSHVRPYHYKICVDGELKFAPCTILIVLYIQFWVKLHPYIISLPNLYWLFT